MGDSEGPLKMKEPQKAVKLEVLAKELDPELVKTRLSKAFDDAFSTLKSRLEEEARDYMKRASAIKDQKKLFQFANNRPPYLNVVQDNAGNITGFSVDMNFLYSIKNMKKDFTKGVGESIVIAGFESGSTKNTHSFGIGNEFAARVLGDALRSSLCVERPKNLAKKAMVPFEDVLIPEGHYPLSLEIVKSTVKIEGGKAEPIWNVQLNWPEWIEKGEMKFEENDKTEGKAILKSVPKKLV